MAKFVELDETDLKTVAGGQDETSGDSGDGWTWHKILEATRSE